MTVSIRLAPKFATARKINRSRVTTRSVLRPNRMAVGWRAPSCVRRFG